MPLSSSFALPTSQPAVPGRIGIMAAMPQELAAVLAAMPDEARVGMAGRDFWVGHLHGRDVVVVLSRIGKVAAATTTTLLIQAFGVSQVVFTGVAGGLGEDVQVGDVVLGQALLQHDMDASPLFPRFELPGTGVSRMAADAPRTERVREALAHALGEGPLTQAGVCASDLQALGVGLPRLHVGLIVSGDRFMGAQAACDELKAALPDALAVEMEGAAVAQVCHDFGVPCTVVRTISDRADDTAHVDFGRFIEQVASPYAVAVLTALLPVV